MTSRRRSFSRKCLVMASALAIISLTRTAIVRADEASDFFRGKKINIIVGFNPGGGYDTYARLLARHFTQHIPGAPAITVQNMPGAGSLRAVRYLDMSAPKDGTTISTFNAGLLVQAITDPKNVGLNFADFSWLGSISEDIRVCFAWHTKAAKSLADYANRKELVFGGTSPGTLGYIEARVIKEYLNVPLKLVLGYPGSAEKRIAIESGELDGDCGGWVNVPDEWVTDKKITVITRFSRTLIPGLDASMPYAGDVIKGDLQKRAFALLMAPEEIGRPFIMSKDVPTQRVTVLRKAFDETVESKAFRDDAERQKLSVSPIAGGEVEAMLRKLNQSPDEVVREAKRISGD